MSHIGVHGSYFSVNFGDILLVEIARNMADSASKQHKLINPTTRVVDALDGRVEVGTQGIEKMLFSGGGYLGASSGNAKLWAVRNNLRHATALRLALNYPSYFYGIGFGPLPDSSYKDKAMNALNAARCIYFRDIESNNFYKEYGGTNSKVGVIPDAATLFSLKDNALWVGDDMYMKISPEKEKKKPVGLIHIEPNHSSAAAVAILDGVAKLTQQLQGKYEIRIISDGTARWKKNAQESAAIRINQSLPEIPFVKFSSCRNLLTEIAHAEWIITTKLHVGIFGAALNKNVIAIPHHTKVIRFYKQIGEMHRVLATPTEAQQVVKFSSKLIEENKKISLSDDYRREGKAARERLVSMLRSTG